MDLNGIGKYRVRRLALQLQQFTAKELEAAAGVTYEVAQAFIQDLSNQGPNLVRKEKIETGGKPGRPPLRYELTQAGQEDLAKKNLALARDLNEIASPQEQEVEVEVEPAHPAWRNRWRLPELPRVPQPAYVMGLFQTEWDLASQFGASAVMLGSGHPVSLKTPEGIKILSAPRRTSEELWEIVHKVLTPWQADILRQKGSVICSYRAPEHDAMELRAQMMSGDIAIELRRLPAGIPSLEELGVPSSALEFAEPNTGLIVTTGVAGSGRSAVVAALLDHINTTRRNRIITVEEPQLYCHAPKLSCVQQRQVGIDIPDLETGLKDLSTDANVVALSDVTDANTFSLALGAAERSLVVCRVTASGPVEAIEKLVALSPPAEQPRVRCRLAANLTGVIARTPLPSAEGHGFVYAAEVLPMGNAARELVRDAGQIHGLSEHIAKTDPKAQTFKIALARLYKDKRITAATVERYLSPDERIG